MNHNHPFYCVWCGETLPDEKSFKEHYRKEIEREEEITEEEFIDHVYNEKHY